MKTTGFLKKYGPRTVQEGNNGKKAMRLIMQRKGILLGMDLPKTERKREKKKMGVSKPEGGIRNGVWVLIMHTGQP